MKTLNLSILGLFAIANLVLAQTETPEDFCKRTAGATYTPEYDASGVFFGKCVTAAISICLGAEYTHAQTGNKECCLPPSTVQFASGKEGCCPAGQNFKWDGTTPSCVTPPPPPPAISCPASNFQWVQSNGIWFQVFCNHAVRSARHIWNTVTFLGVLGGPDSYLMASDLSQCIAGCAANAACNGANFWPARGFCAMNTLPQQPNFLSEGSLYELPPPPAYGPYEIIAVVPVPRRH